MNDWRYVLERPGAAHLWESTSGGLWRTACGRMLVVDLLAATAPLPLRALQHKCLLCIDAEIRSAQQQKTRRSKAGPLRRLCDQPAHHD